MLCRNTFVSRIICGYLAFCIFNTSVDGPDRLTSVLQPSENLSLNDPESLIEIVLENVLGFDKAIPEYLDPDNGKAMKNLKNTSDQYVAYHIGAVTPLIYTVIQEKFDNYSSSLASHSREIHSPPPEV